MNTYKTHCRANTIARLFYCYLLLLHIFAFRLCRCTVRFYNQYKEEIDGLLYELMYKTGLYTPSDLFGDKWDKEDPLAAEDFNQNLLAWFGFEETLRKIGYKFEQLENCI